MSAELPSRNLQLALRVAGELWGLMREDASHRLGIAQAFPEPGDRKWSPEFYRKCQLAERLYSILDEIVTRESPQVGSGNDAGKAPVTLENEGVRVIPHIPKVSRRRFGV